MLGNLAVAGFGQVNATVGGTVSDSSGALIPGVEITARNVNTGIVATRISNEAGNYEFPSLQPGVYTVSASLAQRRFAMTLLSLFAVVALALAAIGVYGVLAFLVSQGTREVGIRIALGATPWTILGMVVGRGLGVTVAGVLIGLAGAFALTRFMQSLLFGVPAADLATFGGVAVVATLIAIAASVIPARRASAVDPMVSLRSE